MKIRELIDYIRQTVDLNIYRTLAPVNADYPLATIVYSTSEQTAVLKGDTNYQSISFTITVFAETQTASDDFEDEIISRLQTLPSTYLTYNIIMFNLSNKSSYDYPDEQTNKLIYANQLDYKIKYKNS